MASGFLTTHVLDIARGCPAADLSISLFRIDRLLRHHICTMQTNADGRTDSPILPQADIVVGIYELVFAAGDYLRACGHDSGSLFLDDVPVRFGLTDADQHYHIPLLLSPFGYSTYRGS